MDWLTVAMVVGGIVVLAAPYLPKLPVRLPQGDTLLGDLAVVRRLGGRLRDEGNLDGARAANALVEAALSVALPQEKSRSR